MEEMDKIIISQILGSDKLQDSFLVKSCSLIIKNKLDEVDIEQIKLTGRSKDLLKFASEYQAVKNTEYALDNKYFPLNDIPFSVADFELNYTRIKPQDRIKVAKLLQEHGGDGLAIRYYTGNENLVFRDENLQKMATKSLSEPIYYTALKLLNSGEWKGIRKVAELLEATGEKNPIYTLFNFELKKEAATEIPSYDSCKKALGEKAAGLIWKNGQFDEQSYNALPKPDKELINKYESVNYPPTKVGGL